MSEKSKVPKLIVILGPTSSGKSDLAVKIAKRFNAEIVSADSRQVYKGLDIGTGKITKNEMRGVKHHLLDVASPQRRFTASDYVKLAGKKIAQIVNRKKIPIICGGGGFYIDALLGEKQIPEVQPDPKLRKKLEKKSVEELFKILLKLDSQRARSIDHKNPRRLIRAIEIAKKLGKVPPLRQGFAGQANYGGRSTRYEVLRIGIKIPDLILKKRILNRLDKRIKQGMIAEAKRLHAQGLSYKRMRELGLEYRALADLLSRRSQSASRPQASGENKITKKQMIARLQKEIWQYAKRQMTYFKKDKKVIWIPPKYQLAAKIIKNFLLR